MSSSFALFLGQLLGVVQAFEPRFGRQDDGRRDHGAEHRPPAHLVAPGNAQKAALARSALQLPSAYRCLGHAASIKTKTLRPY